MDKKTIRQAALKYYNNLPFMQHTERAFTKFEAIFRSGATWRINSVWHDASKERPERGRHYLATVEIPSKAPIIAIWKDDYRGQANHPFFQRWAYPEDFMPERKEDKP